MYISMNICMYKSMYIYVCIFVGQYVCMYV